MVERLLKLSTVAERLDVSVSTVRRLITAGHIHAVHVDYVRNGNAPSGPLRVPESEVERLTERQAA
ncbi:helix-turn-helix domain-containing protein [Gulosibacter molinativorax]|uniref:Helix-turn-helix domain-containing protein n=1 Tax=Gulosibacter molinativorax TaxID=256821 RepID=A0ABT7C660_9MICO|nr:helix-turn-helix domain-containing protein [Gulosibacter molinativorax]MDJ1370668.1 helix-turn-helix domain-containing protein [Gulosibacter molinativorax]QUY63305.1 Hypotetical protein [Gulosibacter molinativorax]